MPIRALVVLAGATLAMAILPSPAAAQQRALAELRVEGPGQTLDPGTWYVTGTERIRRSRPSNDCIRRDGWLRFTGPTAIGIPQTGAAHRKRLRQVRVRMDEAGPFMCEIGSIVGRSFTDPAGFAGWTYRHNWAFGESSADLVRLRNGDQVLWVFSDFNSNPAARANTGEVLELRGVPARAGGGELTVRVVAHSFDGSKAPATGATIVGASTSTHIGDGRYRLTVPRGRTTLSATRGSDVRSNRRTTCFLNRMTRCPRAHGRRIFGSPAGDRIPGTRGDDVIRAGAGDDIVDLRRGGRNKVNCGAGRDRVLLRRGERGQNVLRNCEQVTVR